MILIVDSGSSKADWVILDLDLIEISTTSTVGLNPSIIQQKSILAVLSSNTVLTEFKEKISKVYFYGAGCSSKEMNLKIEKTLAEFFKNAIFSVKNDLYSATFSTYQGVPCLVGILGTGSNVCYFDGKNIRLDFISLGYTVGDYGGGSYLGKNLLSAFAENKLSKEITGQLIAEYNLTTDSILENLYTKELPNKYLASFAPFILKNINNEYLNNMVYKSFIIFFEKYVLLYPEAQKLKLNLVGSVAFHFKELLTKAALDRDVSIGTIIQKPIEGLINFHKKYLN